MMPLRNILLVEDNLADVELTEISLEQAQVLGAQSALHVVHDGQQAIDFLHQHKDYADAPRPDLILLDLNLPGKNGRDVLREIKDHEDLRSIPVAILSSSNSQDDVTQAYRLHANCYLRKPTSLADFQRMIECFRDFWLDQVVLPPPR